MTESSRFWQTNGTGDGPSGGYSAQQFYDFLRKLLITDQQASQGIIFGEGNQLVGSGTASPISIDTGSAIVYGFFYENTAVVNLAVTTPTIGTTGGRVNLKADWTAQTIRLVALRSADGVSSPPSLTQNPGSVYELPLYTFTITTGGVIALTDVRGYLQVGSKILPNAVDTSAIVNGSVNSDKLANGAVIAGKIATGGVSAAAQIANTIVSDNHIANRIIMAKKHQASGNQDDWAYQGSTNWDISNIMAQFGNAYLSWADGVSDASVSITFPDSFSASLSRPWVIATLQSFPLNGLIMISVESISKTGVTIRARRSYTTGAAGAVASWLAFGPVTGV